MLFAVCECVILMLTDASAIQSVLLSDFPATSGRRTVIQMGTITPTESRAISDEIVAAGGDHLEAPVLGSIPEAKAGKLIVVGGSTEQFHRWSELLQNFSSEPVLIGSSELPLPSNWR